MLCVARSIRAEPPSGEIFRRNQRPPHGHGKGQEANLITAPSLAVQFPEDKFLKKAVEVNLEQAQVAAGSNRGTKVIAKFQFGKIVFCSDDEPSLIQRAQPGVGMLGRNSQRAVCETLFGSI